jgi:hypothetical protein
MCIRAGVRPEVDRMYDEKMNEAIDIVIRLRKCQRSLGEIIVRVKYCGSAEGKAESVMLVEE